MLAVTKEVAEIVKANANEIYKDSAQPSVRILGKSLAQCVSLFATPLGRMAQILEKNIHRYLHKLEGLNEGEITIPDTRVLVPILEKMRFTEEEKVAEYYAQILATASTKEHAGRVMVAFIEILNRLSADEIKILEYINSPSNKINITDLTNEELLRHGFQKGVTELELKGSLPTINVNLVNEHQEGFRTIVKNFNCLTDKISLDIPSNLHSYLDNMISLGLLHRNFTLKFAVHKIYAHLEKHKDIVAIQQQLKESQRLDFDRGRIDTTDLGISLLELCSSQRTSQKIVSAQPK